MLTPFSKETRKSILINMKKYLVQKIIEAKFRLYKCFMIQPNSRTRGYTYFFCQLRFCIVSSLGTWPGVSTLDFLTTGEETEFSRKSLSFSSVEQLIKQAISQFQTSRLQNEAKCQNFLVKKDLIPRECTQPRFNTEARSNSEMVYCRYLDLPNPHKTAYKFYRKQTVKILATDCVSRLILRNSFYSNIVNNQVKPTV